MPFLAAFADSMLLLLDPGSIPGSSPGIASSGKVATCPDEPAKRAKFPGSRHHPYFAHVDSDQAFAASMTTQRFNFEIGRVSSMNTVSPTLALLASSCA